MTKRHFIFTGVAVLLVSAVGLRAQTTTGNVTQAAGEAKVTTEQIIGEVALVDGNRLVVKLEPKGSTATSTSHPDGSSSSMVKPN